jgi:hypothetical protein
MKKERQIGVRVGLPAFFALELEDVYKHTEGAHRALAFPDFCGLLIGLGLEAYRKQNAVTPERETAPDIEDEPEEEKTRSPVHLFDMAPEGLPDLFRDFDEVMRSPEEKRGLRLVRAGERSS